MSYSSDNIGLIRSNTASSIIDGGDVYSNLFYQYLMDSGGGKNPALTIDIINKSELEQQTISKPNKGWVADDRLRGNLITTSAIWGFKDATNDLRHNHGLSNTFVFGGQNTTFYIAPRGHSVGYIDDSWVYCKTTITISVVDVFNRTETALKTFSDFTVDNDDDSRYFSWTVPDITNDAFSNYGLYGLNVIKIEVQNEYYEDASWSTVKSGSFPNISVSYLQVLTYSGAKEIIEVDVGDADILTSTPSYSDSLSDIFEESIFADISSLDSSYLQTDYKRAIIADQIASIFMSQHGVIIADNYPGKIVGFGAESATGLNKEIDRALIYAQKYPDIIPLVKDRLFGILADYKFYNYVLDIESVVTDHTQSNQDLRDPARVISFDEDGVVTSEIGINGVLFDPYVVKSINAESVRDVPTDFSFDFTIREKQVDVYDLTITNGSGAGLSATDTSVKVSFSVSYGSSNISSIKYIFVTENGVYSEYVDSTGLTRTHTFNLYGDQSLADDNVVIGQVKITDIYGNSITFSKNDYIPQSQKAYLTNMEIVQKKDGSDNVEVSYIYSNLETTNSAIVTFQYSKNGGTSWLSSLYATGDIGSGILPGKKQIIWNASSDLQGVDEDDVVLAKILIEDSDGVTFNSLTGALVFDFDSPEILIMKNTS